MKAMVGFASLTATLQEAFVGFCRVAVSAANPTDRTP